MQEIVSIRDANHHLCRYLERVEQGAEISITRRGKPIARVLPIESRPRLSDPQQAARERPESVEPGAFFADNISQAAAKVPRL